MNRFEARRQALVDYCRTRRTPPTVAEAQAHLKACGFAAASTRTLYMDVHAVNATAGGRYGLEARDGRIHYEGPEDPLGHALSTEQMAAALAAWKHTDFVTGDALNPPLATMEGRLRTTLERSHGIRIDLWRFRAQGGRRRRVDCAVYTRLSFATALRRRAAFSYHARGSDRISSWQVSPQAILQCAGTYYLYATKHGGQHDGHDCTLSLDRITDVEVLPARALDRSAEELERSISTSYGAFAGEPEEWAHLRFTAAGARWAADEEWHPNQRLTRFEDGGCEILIPYANPEELIRAVLAYGPDVEVVEPTSLREAVQARLRASWAIYVPVATEKRSAVR